MYTETEKVVCSKADRQMECPNDPGTKRKYTLWGEWGACTSPCNGNRRGKQIRSRMCLKPKCRKKDLTQTRKCESTCNPEGKNFNLILVHWKCARGQDLSFLLSAGEHQRKEFIM